MLLIYLSLVFIRFSSQFQAEGNLRRLEDKQIKLKGKVSSEPILQGSSQRFRMGKIRIKTKQYPRYRYGENVQVVGTLQRKAINRWYSQFSLIYPSVELIKADRVKFIGFDWKEAVMRFRKRIEMVFNRNLSEPEASLLAGIVLGSKRGLGNDFWQALQRTGTLHIVVASGYNVTVVIGVVISYLAGLFKRRTAVMLGIMSVIGYTVMAGAEAAIVRAAIMGSLAYFGQVLGRKADGVRMLLAAIMVMLLVEPYLIFDVGFQLSVMATAGLMFVGPILGKVFNRIWVIGGDIRDTVSAQIAVWPILLIVFGNLSVFAVLVNSLILFWVPIVMGLGAILGLAGLIFGQGLMGTVLGQVIGGLVYAPLTLMVKIIEGFGNKEWMSLVVEDVSWWWGLGYYLVLVIVIVLLNRREKVGLTGGDLELRS